ncbi:hypothetical protein [uncultured Imperialibacter sp.]|uniref:hypothetical protein n=1 Tax=uncultured Imperialibacter sp. TaxID=1672639 RepID=UPI0030D861B0|tara:strand:- start:84395 stop:84772 length:378 start_codon:yes stop_codon:yes gene_type:complete
MFNKLFSSSKGGLKKKDFQHHADLAVSHQKDGNHMEAVNEFNICLKKRPNDCNICFLRSSSFKELHELDKAIDDLKVAVEYSELDDNKIYDNRYFNMGFESAKQFYADQLKIYERIKMLTKKNNK